MHNLIVEQITPKEAEKMLATMVTNRGLSEAKIFDYAIAMDEGKWALNGETLKFDQFGRLFDGQHRLRACILAEKPFRTYVARGIEDERAFATVDVGKIRTAGDIFHIAGFAGANEVAAAALLVYLFKHGQLDWRGPRGGAVKRAARPNNTIGKKMGAMPHRTAHVQKDVLLEYSGKIGDGLMSVVRAVKQIGVRKIIPNGMAAGLYYLFREKSFDDAEKYFYDMTKGTGLSSRDAVYHPREHLIMDRSELKHMNRWTVVGLAIKCWNKRRASEEIKHLRTATDEKFPKKIL